MTTIKTSIGRRSFIKNVTLTGGGMVLGFSWLASCKSSTKEVLAMPKEWFTINGYLKIGENGMVTIMSPNPEIGQNVKTSMPMIVAEELDIEWEKVIIEQADLNTSMYSWQIAGGSMSIGSSWNNLRMAGATARHMLREAAANVWKVPMDEVVAENGMLTHKKTNKSAHYGEMASAASKLTVPKEVKLKEVKDFKIIGTSKKNVDAKNIVTGKALFGLDYKEEGMLIAMTVHPPAFGLKLKSMDDTNARSMPGIKDVFKINLFNKGYSKSAFDATSFDEIAVVVGNSTWEVLNAKNVLKIEWEPIKASKEKRSIFGNEMEVITPAGLENTDSHMEQMKNMASKSVKIVRKDGNPETAFKKAAFILERSYSCPFLAHNPMEPMNFFANVTTDKAVLVGPVQTPEIMQKSVSERIGLPLEKIQVKLTRMGGGFGRRLYGHFMIEAAIISQKMKAPVKLIYTREDDMSYGIYRPAYYATYKAAFDEKKNLIAFHVNTGGITESPLSANRFPAGAIDNYLAEEWEIPSNISTGAFRAPGSNFMAGAEQSFLDEMAEYMGKDPIAMRLELFDRAKTNPVGEKNDYNAERYAGVLKLVKEKAEWDKPMPGIHRGVSAYYCHNSYVAHVLDIVMENQKPVIKKVTSAVDCGIVINMDAATNLSQGAVVDAVGHSLYSNITFKDGLPLQNNFNTYRLIRMSEAPKEIDVHFIKSEIDPTGMGEPSGPPVIAALANALYKATGKRVYHQPFFS